MSRILGLIVMVGASAVAPSLLITANNQDAPKTPTAAGSDLALVERVNAARNEYRAALESLREYYDKTGDVERRIWVEEELISYHRISKRAYRLDLDVPPPTLQPKDNIAEANELYRRATQFYKEKGFGQQSDDNIRRSEILMQQLLSTYPTSDKIDDAAYVLGLCYESRVFKQYQRAALYFERVFQWNPNSDTDARLRAARLYDRQLQDRSKAIQFYRDVVNHDGDLKRVEEAKKRLQELSALPPR